MKINFDITDDEPYLLTVNAGVLLYQKGTQADDADATLTLTKKDILKALSGDLKDVDLSGDASVIDQLTAPAQS